MGRQLVRTPYINPYDVRMIPLTFEGIVLLPERQQDQALDYIASYLWRYKPRNQADFIPFSEGLGVEEDEGVLITGIRRRTKAWNYGLTNYWIKDTLNTAYGEIDYLLPFGGGEGQPSVRISVNDLDQRSVGADLIAGAPKPIRPRRGSSPAIGTWPGARAPSGLTQKPFGQPRALTNNRAGEQAYLAGLSYDFADFGLDGLKFYVGWGRGTDIVDPSTGAPEPDQSEFDLRAVLRTPSRTAARASRRSRIYRFAPDRRRAERRPHAIPRHCELFGAAPVSRPRHQPLRAEIIRPARAD